MDKSNILVPYGWKRSINNEGKYSTVHYTSPSNVVLSSVAEVCQYLEKDDTCKCGLSCPILVPKVFSFNPEVSSMEISHKEWLLRRHNQPPGKCMQWNNLAKQILSRKSCSSPSGAPPAKLIIRRKGGRLTSVIPSDSEDMPVKASPESVKETKTPPPPAQVVKTEVPPQDVQTTSKPTSPNPFKLQWIPTEEQNIKTDLPDLGNISSPPTRPILQSSADSSQRLQTPPTFPTIQSKPEATLRFGMPVKFNNTAQTSFSYPLPTLPSGHQQHTGGNENNSWLPPNQNSFKGNSVFYKDDSNRVFGEYSMNTANTDPNMPIWNQQQHMYPQQQNLQQNKMWQSNTSRFPMSTNQQFPVHEFSKPFRPMLPENNNPLIPNKFQNYNMNVSRFPGQQMLPVLEKQDSFHQPTYNSSPVNTNQWGVFGGNKMPALQNQFVTKAGDDQFMQRQKRQPRNKKPPKAKPRCASLSQSALDILDTLSEKCRKDTKVADALKVQHYLGMPVTEQQQAVSFSEVKEETNVQSSEQVDKNISPVEAAMETEENSSRPDADVSDGFVEKSISPKETPLPEETYDKPSPVQTFSNPQPPTCLADLQSVDVSRMSSTEKSSNEDCVVPTSIHGEVTQTADILLPNEEPERPNVKLRMLAATESPEEDATNNQPSCSHLTESNHQEEEEIINDTKSEEAKEQHDNDTWLETGVDHKSVVAIEKLVKTIMKQNTGTVQPEDDERNNPHLKDMIQQCLHLQNEILEKVKNIKKPEDEGNDLKQDESGDEANTHGLQVPIVSSSVKPAEKTSLESIVESLNEDSDMSDDDNISMKTRSRSGQIQKQDVETGVTIDQTILEGKEENFERNKEKAVNLRNKAALSSNNTTRGEPSHKSFKCGDLIWGQMRGYPSWPGKIVSANDVRCIQQRTPLVEGKVWIKWFGDQTFAQMNPHDLKSLNEGLDFYTKAKKKCRTRKKTNNRLEHAIQEAVDELEMQQILAKQSTSSS